MPTNVTAGDALVEAVGRNSYEDCLRALGDGAYVDHLASEHSAYTGYTPLYLAVESGTDGKIAKLLLDRGANVNTPVSVHRRRQSCLRTDGGAACLVIEVQPAVRQAR